MSLISLMLTKAFYWVIECAINKRYYGHLRREKTQTRINTQKREEEVSQASLDNTPFIPPLASTICLLNFSSMQKTCWKSKYENKHIEMCHSYTFLSPLPTAPLIYNKPITASFSLSVQFSFLFAASCPSFSSVAARTTALSYFSSFQFFNNSNIRCSLLG